MDDGVSIRSHGEYESIVAERLTDRGYERLDGDMLEYDATAFHRRDRSLVPPGTVERVVVLGRFASPTVSAVREFSTRAYRFGRDHEATRSRLLGGIPTVFPVAACENPEDAPKRWIATYHAGHRRGYEFPVLADLPAETVHYFRGTPLLGGRAYEGFRKTAADAFDPSTADVGLGGP